MSEPKTKVNNDNVKDFINSAQDVTKRADCFKLLEIFSRITGEKPKMWGTSIIGFGQYHYKSERSAQEGDWMLTGFSPRKQNLTLYIMTGFKEYADILQSLGKHKISTGCLYFKTLSDVDQAALEKLIELSYNAMKQQNAVT